MSLILKQAFSYGSALYLATYNTKVAPIELSVCFCTDLLHRSKAMRGKKVTGS